MSPRQDLHTGIENRFPRVSGDEPAAPVTIAGVAPFSPRERG